MGKDSNSTGKVKFIKVKEGDIVPEEPKFEIEQNSLPEFELPEPKALYDEELSELKTKVEEMGKKPQLDKPQADILKKYIDLKEKEGRDIKDQIKQYDAYVKKLNDELKNLTERNQDMESELALSQKEKKRLQDERSDLSSQHQKEMATLKSVYEDRISSSDKYEKRLSGLKNEKEDWKNQVREDLKRIKLKEKELENKYELLKRDAQALLDSKDQQVLELKKKADSLEIDMESKDDGLQEAGRMVAAIDVKKQRLIETLQLAIALLENIDRIDEDSRKAG